MIKTVGGKCLFIPPEAVCMSDEHIADANKKKSKTNANKPPKQSTSETTLSTVSIDPDDPKSYGYDSDFDMSSMTATRIGADKKGDRALPDDWPDQIQGRKTSLMGLLRHLVLNHELTDCTIIISGKKFNCHKLVLQCYSKYFRKERTADEFTLPDHLVTVKGFVMLYDWMLADLPIIQRASLIELFRASTFLGVEELESQCWRCIDNDATMREMEAFKLYEEAQALNFDYMNPVLMSRISKYFIPLAASERFLSLPMKDVCFLLASDAIAVNSEMEVMMAAIRWLVHDFENRKPHTITLLSNVRFQLMPCWYLASLDEFSSCTAIATVFSIEEACEFIQTSLSYTTALENRVMCDEDFEIFVKTHYNTVPQQRQWVYDVSCPYHHHIQCKRITPLTMDMFDAYCERFRAPETARSWLEFVELSYDDQQPAIELGGVKCMNRQCLTPIQKCRLPWRPNRVHEAPSSITNEVEQRLIDVNDLSLQVNASGELMMGPRQPQPQPQPQPEADQKRNTKNSAAHTMN